MKTRTKVTALSVATAILSHPEVQKLGKRLAEAGFKKAQEWSGQRASRRNPRALAKPSSITKKRASKKTKGRKQRKPSPSKSSKTSKPPSYAVRRDRKRFEMMTNLERVRMFLRDKNPDLSQITLQEIRNALHDIIRKAQPLRWNNREAANQLQAEIPNIFRLKARKLASMGSDALAEEISKVRRRMQDPDRINIYDQTDWDCLLEAEKTLR
jgi:hypothetical protein